MAVESLLLPGVVPRGLTEGQLLAREAYRKGALPSVERATRRVVSKDTARANVRAMLERMDAYLTAKAAP